MHNSVEIILPEVNDVEEAVSVILDPFNEYHEDSAHAFWDWYVIGGRFSGGKLEASLDPDKINWFYKELNSREIQVKGFVSGKQEIATLEQQSDVDKLWQEVFPESNIKSCPFFKHSNDQYDSNSLLPLDVCKYSEVPKLYKASRVIIAAPNYEGNLAAHFMISTDFWNGVTWVDSNWSGVVVDAVEMFKSKITNHREEYRAQFDFNKFISVTVDCHS